MRNGIKKKERKKAEFLRGVVTLAEPIHAQSNQPVFDGWVVKLLSLCVGRDPKLVC